MSEQVAETSKEMTDPAGSGENPADTKKEWPKELPVEAMNHLFQGRRHLLVHDYSSAVASLQEACELFVKFYGPMAYECGEIHYYYGKALLELARQETGFLGDALERESEGADSQENSDEDAEGDKDGTEDSAEESKADSEDVDAEESIGSSDPGKTDSDDQNRGDGDDKSDGGGNTETKSEDVQTKCSDEPGPSSSKNVDDKEEDITTLQLAWEVLETAKLIFQRHSPEEREDQLKVAEILLALGEISLEEENFQGSLEDLQKCLKIHKQYLSPDDRLLAQTYYQLGLAYSFTSDYDSALENYQKSVDVIEIRISSLKSQIVPGQQRDFSMEDPAKEIEELESLLPDIKAKMEDTQELKNSPKKFLNKEEAQKNEELEFGIPSKDVMGYTKKPTTDLTHLVKRKDVVGDTKKPTTDLTHLVKRKKPTEPDNSAEPAAKKLMTTIQDSPSESVTNGSSNSLPPVTSASAV